MKKQTWYECSKMEKDAGVKENLLTIAITSILMLPFDLAALHWAKKLNKTPSEIGQAITPEIWEQAEEVIKQSKTDPKAAEIVDIAKQQGTEILNEKANLPATINQPLADISKWKSDIEIVAKTLFGEARGEGEMGLKGVASVIWNRAGGDISKLKSVCLKPKQFSCWNDGVVTVNQKDKKAVASYQLCVKIAESMFRKTFEPAITADHYYAYKGKNKVKNNPSWHDSTKEVKYKGYTGNHKFFDL